MSWPTFLIGALISMVASGVVLALSAPRYPAVRRWAIVVAASVAAMPLAIVVHNVASALIGGEEAVSFIVALVIAPGAFTIALVGAGLTLARSPGAWTIGVSLLVAGTGMTAFGLYTLGALVVTSLLGGDPPWQGPIEMVVLPISLLALVGGSLSALVHALIPRSVGAGLTHGTDPRGA